MNDENKYTFIYTLNDPITHEIKYVGKTDNLKRRLNEHTKKIKYSKSHKNDWINHLLKNNIKPEIEILDIVIESEWCFWEEHWISLIKTWGFKLTNMTSGGDGGKQNAEANKKISEKLKGKVYSKETINKMRIAKLGVKASYETKLKMSNNKIGIKNPIYGKQRPESTKKYRKVIQCDLNFNEIKIWSGLIIASKELNINRCTITDVCNNRKKSAGGYKWKYA